MDGDEREQADRPYVDRRTYTAWNAALAIAYLEASRRADRPVLRDHALHALERLFRDAYRSGQGMKHAEDTGGQLADQAWSMWAAVRAYQAGAGAEWLERAVVLAGHLEKRYGDANLGGYFDHAGNDKLGRLSEPIKPLAENSVAAMALVELDILTGDPAEPYLSLARRALESVAALPRQYGLMAAVFARALDRTRHAVKVTTANAQLARAAVLAHPYVVIDPAGDKNAVVCVGTICLAPVSTADAVVETLKGAGAMRAPSSHSAG
jgi:uncharacterized protein YyaL (SSP411 family)